MNFYGLLINGLSDEAMAIWEGIWPYAAIFVGGFAAIALIVALFNDRANAVICLLVGIAALFFVHLFSGDPLRFVEESVPQNEANFAFVFLWSIVFFVLMLLRFLPCIRVETEKSTYLIFGTLIEETESHFLGAGVAFGLPLVCSVGYFFLSDFLVNNGWFYIGYIAVGVFLLTTLIGLIRSFFD